MTTANASSPPALLTLPLEIRQQIYRHVYQDINIMLSEIVAAQHASLSLSDCEACQVSRPSLLNTTDRKLNHALNSSFQSLLTCRQIYIEACQIYYANLVLHLSNSPALLPIVIRRTPSKYRENVRNVIIWTHINEATRPTTLDLLIRLPRLFPALKSLTINHHMRPPVSYDHLVDAVYLVGPLVRLSPPFNVPANNEIDPVLAAALSTTPESSSSQPPEDTTVSMALTPEETGHAGASPSTRKSNEGLFLNLAYMKEEVMFEARFLGPISTSDSITEHSAVVRSLFTDPDFLRAATAPTPPDQSIRLPPVPGAENVGSLAAIVDELNAEERWTRFARGESERIAGEGEGNAELMELAVRLTEMTGALLMTARRFERPWFEKLQRRRLVAMYMEQGTSREEAERIVDGVLSAEEGAIFD